MALDSIDNATGFGAPDYGPNYLVVNSIPYPLEMFQEKSENYECITLKGDDREFVGDTYYLTPSRSKAKLLIEASSINFKGRALKAIRPISSA